MARQIINKRNVARSSTQKDNVAYAIPSFKQTHTLIPLIESAFLKDRVAAYVESAYQLADALPQSAQENAGLIDSLASFAKNARRLDMILAITVTAGNLPRRDTVTAQRICQSIENAFAANGTIGCDGRLIIVGPDGSLDAELHSGFGRGLAKLLARFVRPATQDAAAASALNDSFLPKDARDKNGVDLAAAKAHWQAGRPVEAEQLCKDILKRNRKDGEAIRLLCTLYLSTGNPAAAAAYLQEALLLYPNDIQLLTMKGEIFIESGGFDEARDAYQKILRLEPNNISALVNGGVVQFMQGADEKAKSQIDRAASLAPNSAEALAALGLYYQYHYEIDKAAMYYARALKSEPDRPQTLANFGSLLAWQQKYDQAITMVDRALTFRPNDARYQLAKAMFLLALGKYSEGWALYETRRQISQYKIHAHRLATHKPLWTGEANLKKKLLIYAEQGLGDSLQFVRYAALCKARVGKVYVLCPQTLHRLFENCPYIDGVFTQISGWRYDEQVATMSLPHIFDTTLDSVPADIPYLFVPPKEQKKWAPAPLSCEGKMRIGLVWSGSGFTQAERGDLRSKHRNIELEQLLPLFEFKNVVFFNLQQGEKAKQIDELGLRSRFIDFMPNVKDMQDTAAIISNLDLVLSVDTSVAHLAGALGKPVWIMSRYEACWRWLKNRPESPWYPSSKIFGQPKMNDWNSVIENICAALHEQLAPNT